MGRKGIYRYKSKYENVIQFYRGVLPLLINILNDLKKGSVTSIIDDNSNDQKGYISQIQKLHLLALFMLYLSFNNNLNDIIKPFSIVNCYYYRNSKMHIIKQLYSNIQNIQNKFIITIKNKNYNMDNINKLTKKRINILRYNELSQELANQISILIDVDDTRIEFYIPIYIMSFKQYIQGQKKRQKYLFSENYERI